MREKLMKSVPRLLSVLVLAGVSLAAWSAWLGWDQQGDVQADGSTTGPYEAWQVIGLVLTLLVPVCWLAFRRYFVGAVLGTTVGLTVAAYYDWSDDASGLFAIGVGMVMLGTLAATIVLSAVIASLKRDGRGRRIGA
jgi:FtsH-binding integral membrane protein